MIVSPDAEDDITEATEYIRDDRGDRAANTFVQSIYAGFQRLAEYPALGKRRDELAAELRGIPLLSYIILYYDHERYIEIVCVAHQSRDLNKLFQERVRGRLPRS